MINYGTIKQLAKDTKRPVTEFIALAPANDPFYCGTPADQAAGEWFADLWNQFGYRQGVHLRRIHYQVVSQSPCVKLPDGSEYENTERCWDYLSQASKMARYLTLVEPGAFVDRRNHEPIINANGAVYEPEIAVTDYSWSEMKLPDFPEIPDYSLYDFDTGQRYHLELWCEKTTMDDVLRPICSAYSANLVRGVGELSITATLELAKRIEQANKPTRVFYISDFDPAGKSMPVAVSRKTEYFIRLMESSLDVRVYPLVLTESQVAAYQLPRTPIKDSEKRKDKFEQRFGFGATELDALEALLPGQLDSILRSALDNYFDPTLKRRVAQATNQARRELETHRQLILSNFEGDIEDMRAEYTQLKAEFEQKLASYDLRRSVLWSNISDSLSEDRPDIEDFKLPAPAPGQEMPDPLYDSTLDYLDQIENYKTFQGKF